MKDVNTASPFFSNVSKETPFSSLLTTGGGDVCLSELPLLCPCGRTGRVLSEKWIEEWRANESFTEGEVGCEGGRGMSDACGDGKSTFVAGPVEEFMVPVDVGRRVVRIFV